jgi:hypothetical protein
VRLRRTVLVAVAATVVIVAGGIESAPAASTLVPTFATWTSGTVGSIGATGFTTSTASSLADFDLSTADYDPPGSDAQTTTNWSSDATLTVTFDAAITDVAVYFKYLRGADASGPTSYELSSTGGCTWSIQSGLTSTSLSGTTFTTTGFSFDDGILLCSGTVTSLTLTPTGGSGSNEAMTLATLTAPTPTTSSSSTTSTTATTTPSAAVAADTVEPTFTG